MSFPRYESYKGSGVEWLGEVPSHWAVGPIKNAFHIVGGGTPKSDERLFWDGDIPWFTPVDLSDSGIARLGQSTRTITKDGLNSSNATLVPPGSVIVSTRAPIGSLGITTLPASTNQGCKSLIPKGQFFGELIAYVLLAAVPALRVRGKGSTFLELSGEELGSFRVPIPPLLEQRAIAAFLDRETGKIDALIEDQTRLIELLKEKRQAVISHAVTKGLNPDAPMKDSGIEWLGEVPSHWEVKRMAELFIEVAEPGSDELPVLSVSIHDGVSDDEIAEEDRARKVTRSEDRSKYKRVRPNDLVYNMMRAWQGGFGTVEVEGAVSPAYVVASPKQPGPTKFIEWLLRTPTAVEEMRRRSKGVTDFRLRLYWDEFKDMQVAVPPASERESIVIAITEMVERWDAMADEVMSALDLLQERRSALISAAVTGKIDVRGLVPDQTEAA